LLEAIRKPVRALLRYVPDFRDPAAARERRFDDEQRTLAIGKTYSGCPD